MHVVLARPHHLDRAPGLLRQHHRVDDEIDVAVAAPAEAAAHQQSCSFTLSLRDAEELGRRFGRGGLALRAGPDLDRIAGRRDGGDGVQRLHLRVIGIVAAILGLRSSTGGLLERAARHRPVALHSVAASLRVLASAANRSMPLSLSKPQAAPVRVQVTDCVSAWRASKAAHGVSATTPTPYGSRTMRSHAGHRLGLGVVDLVRHRAFDRRAQHTCRTACPAPARRCRSGAAVDLARQLDAHHVLADQPEVGRLLELLGLDLRRLRRHFGEGGDFAVAQACGRISRAPPRSARWSVPRPGRPLARRIVEQHAAHLRAERPQRRVVARHRVGAGRVHHAAESPDCRRSPRSAAPARCFTLAQSASSSSAMISGSEVIDPCPISVAADMIVIVPSGRDAHPRAQRLAGALGRERRRARVRPSSATANDSPAAPIMTCGATACDWHSGCAWSWSAPPAPRARSRARCAG